MDRKQEHYTGHRITKHGLVVEGRNTEITLTTDDVLHIVEDLNREFVEAEQGDLGVPRPRRQAPITPDKLGRMLQIGE